MYDVDLDGRDDILLGLFKVGRDILTVDLTRETMPQYCKSKGDSSQNRNDTKNSEELEYIMTLPIL